MSVICPPTFWLLFAAAMLISSIGFYKYVYFISLGYGFSIAGLGALMRAVHHLRHPLRRLFAAARTEKLFL